MTFCRGGGGGRGREENGGRNMHGEWDLLILICGILSLDHN